MPQKMTANINRLPIRMTVYTLILSKIIKKAGEVKIKKKMDLMAQQGKM
jgi:hypothetical protein